jgi:hypothetical protein
LLTKSPFKDIIQFLNWKKSKHNDRKMREIAFCLEESTCIGGSFFAPEMVDRVATAVFSVVEPFNYIA